MTPSSIPWKRAILAVVITVVCVAAIWYGLKMVTAQPVTHIQYPGDWKERELNNTIGLEKPIVTAGPMNGNQVAIILSVVLFAGIAVGLVFRYVPGWVQRKLLERWGEEDEGDGPA